MEFGLSMRKHPRQQYTPRADWLLRRADAVRHSARAAQLAKNLSVNYVRAERHLAEGDDRRGKMVEGDDAPFEVLVSYEQLAIAIEPAMADLDNDYLAHLFGFG